MTRTSNSLVRALLELCVPALLLGCGGVAPEEDVGVLGNDPESALRFTPRVPELAWGSCGEGFPGAECAIAELPLSYAEPWRKAKVSIALAKIPAADPENKIGTLFMNPGGPGGSGVSMVLSEFGGLLSTVLGGRFDLIGFDPRGVGASDPLLCFETAEELELFLSQTPIFPYLRGQERPYFDTAQELTRRCLKRNRTLAPHLSTADVARDLDLLRQAVGDRKLSYIGFSYGSYIGNTYANLFPKNVRAMVIDGVLDPRLWSNGQQIKADRFSAQLVFDEFLRLCDEAGDACALSAPGGAKARFDELARALKKAPLVLEEAGVVYSYDYLLNDASSALYTPEYWVDYALFFALLSEAVGGDPAPLHEAIATRESLRARLQRPASSNSEPYDNFFEAYYANHCADADYPSTLGQFREVGRFAEQGSPFGPLWWWHNAPCASWPSSESRYMGPWTARTSAPVLIVGNHFDPATDYAGAVASSRLLKNSRLLSYAGWGHTAFSRSACVAQHVLNYLLDGILPPQGTLCPAPSNPFIPVEVPALAARAALPQAPETPWIGLPPPIPPLR